jgi:protein-tyrosine sulfotransferase
MPIASMNVALVLGCARSGTSILGELIASHPAVAYLFEPNRIWNLAGPGVNDSHRLLAEHAPGAVRRQIRDRFREQQGAAAMIVEKTPRNVLRVPFLRAVFPEAKLVHIVRDGRDVACSLLPGIGGDEWRHLKPPSWKALFAEHRGVERCALAWREVIEIALEDLSSVPHLQVRYEELVSNPREVARRVFEHLELPLHPRTLTFTEKIQDSTRDSYQPAVQAKWFRDDHESRVGRWRRNLDPTQQRAVEDLLGDVLARLGYA